MKKKIMAPKLAKSAKLDENLKKPIFRKSAKSKSSRTSTFYLDFHNFQNTSKPKKIKKAHS